MLGTDDSWSLTQLIFGPVGCYLCDERLSQQASNLRTVTKQTDKYNNWMLCCTMHSFSMWSWVLDLFSGLPLWDLLLPGFLAGFPLPTADCVWLYFPVISIIKGPFVMTKCLHWLSHVEPLCYCQEVSGEMSRWPCWAPYSEPTVSLGENTL